MIVEYVETPDGRDAVKYDGWVWTPPFERRGVLPQFARYLLSCGVVPETPLEATRGATCVWESGITVGRWAAVSVQETDRPVIMEKFAPLDRDVFN